MNGGVFQRHPKDSSDLLVGKKNLKETGNV